MNVRGVKNMRLQKRKGTVDLTTNAATSFVQQSFVKWNHNWDRRDASSLIKPDKKKKNSDEEMEEKKAELKPTATRHIFLVRHGNYYSEEKKDVEMKLTPLVLSSSTLSVGELVGSISAVRLLLPYLLDSGIAVSQVLSLKRTSIGSLLPKSPRTPSPSPYKPLSHNHSPPSTFVLSPGRLRGKSLSGLIL
ncbi:hypothetical protein TNCV_4137941 [Trichonephila clavipes]|nr:hypothetical protein TNCV_4137941 [Trichonephila clavipes]